MNKKEKAAYLLYELNNIDDCLLEEARLYPAEKRKRSKRTRFIVAISAALIAVMLLLPFGGIVGLTAFIVSLSEDKNEQPAYESPEEYVEEILTSAPETEFFFSGTPCIVWQEEGEESYHTVPIDNYDFYRIKQLSAQSKKADANTEVSERRVWICDGEGLVKTPYLEDTLGNLYYATLFDYNPELILSDELERYLDTLTS